MPPPPPPTPTPPPPPSLMHNNLVSGSNNLIRMITDQVELQMKGNNQL